MLWNWQQPDWPNFSWDAGRIRKAEETFLVGAGTVVGSLQYMRDKDLEQLTVEAISNEALTTSEIEGELLDRASVQSSIRRELGLAADRRHAGPAEQGIAEMLVALYRSTETPLTHATLFEWHAMLLKGRRDLPEVGCYRTSSEPMRVVSGRIGDLRVHFEAPPASTAAAEMKKFISWFNETSPNGSRPLPPLSRAGIAHLYFESIHPFADGNGRIGRAISLKALAQAVEQPIVIALAAQILRRRKDYYAALELASRSNEVTPWLVWFADITLEAQGLTSRLIKFVLDKTRLLDDLRGRLNPRQEKALLRMLREGPKGFTGGLSAGNYAVITGASPATATRDLADLVAKGALFRTGEHRHARYHLTLSRPA